MAHPTPSRSWAGRAKCRRIPYARRSWPVSPASGTKGSDLQRDLGDAAVRMAAGCDQRRATRPARQRQHPRRARRPSRGGPERASCHPDQQGYVLQGGRAADQAGAARGSRSAHRGQGAIHARQGRRRDQRACATPLRPRGAARAVPPPLPEPPDTSTSRRHRRASRKPAGASGREQRRTASPGHQDWSVPRRSARRGRQAWQTLDRLLRHAAPSTSPTSIKAQRDAIEANRLLMDDPDPVTPLISELSDALRAAVIDAATGACRKTRRRRSQSSKARPSGQQLDPADRASLLAGAGSDRPQLPGVGTDDELLKTLDATLARLGRASPSHPSEDREQQSRGGQEARAEVRHRQPRRRPPFEPKPRSTPTSTKLRRAC